jgi:hypothetical protein
MCAPTDETLPDLFIRADAARQGWTLHQMEWAVQSGRWRALRRGIYAVTVRYEALDPVRRHLLDARAALRVHDDRHVLSHLSAALSFGLPCPLEGPGRPSLTIGTTGASTDRQADLIVQVASLRERDIAGWLDGRRTTPARTVADCLRHLSPPDGVAIADAAVRAGLTDEASIDEVLQWQEGWPYVGRGRGGLELVDPRRESWLESYSLVLLHQLGVPLPVPQVAVYGDNRRFIGRVDAYWPDSATVGEADGRGKYAMTERRDGAGSAIDAIDAARRAVIAEKEREDRLRDVGLEVVRWSTYDIVHRAADVAARVRRARDRGDPSRFIGRAVQARHVATTPALAVRTGSEALPQAG